MTAQQQIINLYGEPSTKYQNTYCILWQIKQDFPWFPKDKIFINRDFKNKLHKAFTELESEGLHKEIKTFDGCYQQRNVRGMKAPSLHSWAMALDLNSSTEKLGQEFTNWSDRFIEIMESNDIFWGGRWKRKDNMHFANYNG